MGWVMPAATESNLKNESQVKFRQNRPQILAFNLENLTASANLAAIHSWSHVAPNRSVVHSSFLVKPNAIVVIRCEIELRDDVFARPAGRKSDTGGAFVSLVNAALVHRCVDPREQLERVLVRPVILVIGGWHHTNVRSLR